MCSSFADRRARLRSSSQQGFTLIELLVVMSIGAILFTLGAFAIRQFWYVRALDGAQNQVAVQLRQLQQRVIAETHPLVYGARFHTGDSFMGLIRFDPQTNTCREYQRVNFGISVRVAGPTEIDSDSTEPHVFCRNNLVDSAGGAVSNRATSEYVFFFARGNGTPGQITVRSTNLSRQETVQVEGVTGRITEI